MHNFHDVIKELNGADSKVKIPCLGSKSLKGYKSLQSVTGSGAFSAVRVCKRVSVGRAARHLSVVKHFYATLLARENCVIYNRNGDVTIESGFFQLGRELSILQSIVGRCPHVVELEEVISEGNECFVFLRFAGLPIMSYLEELNSYTAFVMDLENRLMYHWVPQGDVINVLLEEDCANCLQQLLSGLEFLKQNHIVHKDIKPENVLLNYPLTRWRCVGDEYATNTASYSHERPMQLTICDFNISERMMDGRIFDAQGTLLFTPPDVYGLVDREEGVDGYARDAWSAGMVGYCMLAGAYPLPLEGSSLQFQLELLRMRAEGDRISLPRNACIENENLRIVVEGLLAMDASSRLSAADALTILKQGL